MKPYYLTNIFYFTMNYEYVNIFNTPKYLRKPNTNLFVGIYNNSDTQIGLMDSEYAAPFNILSDNHTILNRLNQNYITKELNYFDDVSYARRINRFAVNLKLLGLDLFLTNSQGNVKKTNNMQQFEILKVKNFETYGNGTLGNNMSQPLDKEYFDEKNLNYSTTNEELQYKFGEKFMVVIKSKVDNTCLESNHSSLFFNICNENNFNQLFELTNDTGAGKIKNVFFIKNYADHLFLSFSKTGEGSATAVDRTFAHAFYVPKRSTFSHGNTHSNLNSVIIDLTASDRIYDKNRDIVMDPSGFYYNRHTGENRIEFYDKKHFKFINENNILRLSDVESTLFTIEQVNANTFKIKDNEMQCLEYVNDKNNINYLSYVFRPCITKDTQLFELISNKQKSIYNTNLQKGSDKEEGVFLQMNDMYLTLIRKPYNIKHNKQESKSYKTDAEKKNDAENTDEYFVSLLKNKTPNAIKLDSELSFSLVFYVNKDNLITTGSTESTSHILSKFYLTQNSENFKYTNIKIKEKCLTKTNSDYFTLEECKNLSTQEFKVVDESFSEKDHFKKNNKEVKIFVHRKRITPKNIEIEKRRKEIENENEECLSDDLNSLYNLVEEINLRHVFKNTGFDKLTDEELERFKGRRIYQMSDDQIQELSDFKVNKQEIEKIRDISRQVQKPVEFFHENAPFYSNKCLFYKKNKLNYGILD